MGRDVSSLSSGRVKFLREIVFDDFLQRRSVSNRSTLMVCCEERVCTIRKVWTGGSDVDLSEQEELELIVERSSVGSFHSGCVVSVGRRFLDADHVVPKIGGRHLDYCLGL